MRILAIDTATEACSVALCNDGTTFAHFELCPREHTQRILPLVRDVLGDAELKLHELDALAFGRGPGSFTGVRIGIGIAQGLALGAELPMIGVSTLATMAQGAWRKTGATRVLAAIDARMGEVYWAEYQRDADGVWQGEETEAVLKPDAVSERLQQLDGNWATVGTGWPAWPDMAATNSAVTLTDGEILLPAAEDMLPIARQLLAAQKTVAVEHAEPVYLRNEVAWKKLPGRE
ncbi:tRNA (adenosine(37)-N6)-threonylcarbamoyltransferase complex dimerization subunit type 1 TsaB [Kosakonia sp. H02]|nr:tRNA (adenosine(37)-N6)-threonylcarbamoyltransferase complex dimerization subunit type 1 TsaB [Kosakonia sp. H02]